MYSYNVEGKKDDPFYSINASIESLDKNYGYLAGAAFTIPISVVGIFMVIYF